MNENWFYHRGQALVELATFGSILLFCLGMLVQYGMQANNEQIVGMKAFRSAMRQAWNNTGPSAGASLQLVEDKRMPTPDNAYGLAERSKFEASADVTWDNDLNAPYVDASGQQIDAYLPKQFFQVNGSSYTPTTAAYATVNCNSGATFTVRESSDSAIPMGTVINPATGLSQNVSSYWRQVIVNCNDTVISEPQLTPPPPAGTYVPRIGYYKDASGQEHQITEADVDGDGDYETVVRVIGAVGAPIQQFVVLDSQHGTIDTNKLNENLDARQGILPGYRKTVQQMATLKKQEGTTQIYTEAHPQEREIITRTMRLQNAMGPYEETITSDLNYDQTFNETTLK